MLALYNTQCAYPIVACSALAVNEAGKAILLELSARFAFHSAG